MTIKIWHSYSCNNSSSYRVVARFGDPQAAEAVAAELRAFFPVHAEEMDELGDYSDTPSAAQRALGDKHGFAWTETLYWGDGGLVGDEPDVFTRGEVLIVQHTYCGGLGELPGLLEKLGATHTDQEDTRTVEVSLLFRPSADPVLATELDELFAQLTARKDSYGDLKAPWADHETYGDHACFRDRGTVGIYLPVDPRDLANLERWFVERGIERPSVRIEEKADLATFAAIAKARCTACGGGLDYLDPRLHDIESPQLVCEPCGGLYELSTFLEAK